MNTFLGAVISLLASTLRISTPLALASMGEVFSERAGIVNLGLEGQILTGAFAAVLASYYTGNPYLGILAGMSAGMLLGLLHALFVVKFRANQIVIGVGMNIFALGLTTIGMQTIWGNRGKSDAVTGLPPIDLGILSKIPLIGPILNQHTIIVYVTLAIALLSWFVLFRTTLGLRLRVVGENPLAADTVGIKINPLKYGAVAIGGALSGLAGSYISLSDLSLFSRGMSAGRGFIALAATILGNWNPLGALGGSMIFGFLGALQIRLQATSFPTQFIQMIPYALVILIVAGFVRRVRAPGAVGEIYERGA
ncbi:MAG: ABC transporter permease [Anaerolineae bacterium]|nr:ABC transporter permease [Anaerolineae bacterium]